MTSKHRLSLKTWFSINYTINSKDRCLMLIYHSSNRRFINHWQKRSINCIKLTFFGVLHYSWETRIFQIPLMFAAVVVDCKLASQLIFKRCFWTVVFRVSFVRPNEHNFVTWMKRIVLSLCSQFLQQVTIRVRHSISAISRKQSANCSESYGPRLTAT